MAHLYQHTEKEVHLLSGPSELQPVTIALPHNDYGIITQYTPREKDQDLPQLLSTSEAQHTCREPAIAVSQILIASCKLWVDQRQNDHHHQNGQYTQPEVYRRTRSMLNNNNNNNNNNLFNVYIHTIKYCLQVILSSKSSSVFQYKHIYVGVTINLTVVPSMGLVTPL